MWLLDVDGVINVARPGWGAAPRSGNAYSQATAYRMRWAPALVQRIRGLHESGIVEIRWCTTWCAEADQIERLFGLPPMNRAWSDELPATATSVAKLAAARTVLDQGRYLIWTDDAEVPTSGPVNDELTRAGRALLIAPSPRRGLQPEHLDTIETFARCAVSNTDTAQADALLLARRLLGDQRLPTETGPPSDHGSRASTRDANAITLSE